MYKIVLRLFLLAGGFLTSIFAMAQDTSRREKPQMAELMRSNGKIYVVVAVVLIILTGLFIYLLRLDKKISRLENKGGGKFQN